MDSIDVLEKELDYLNMSLDDIYIESDEPSESKIGKIKDSFNKLSNHLNSAMLYTQSYVDMQQKQKTDSDYEERLKALISKADMAIDNNSDLIAVYDARPIYDKYTKATDNIFGNLEEFITSRNYKTKDDVISKRDSILDIIETFDSSIDDDVDVKVWINPATVKRVCENAYTQGTTFNMNLKHVYMDITRLNNKVSNIVRDEKLNNDIKTELVGSSLQLIKKTASFCVSWNKYIMTHYPMTKA